MARSQPEQLQEQIDAKRAEIRSDQLSVSIGEVASMYRDAELDTHPEFQRLYRWSDEQKSRFIESILLGIPIPSMFVAQREDGKWDVIDGLQRLSTIFQLMGILKDQDGQPVPPLCLTKTKYLSALEGMKWKGDTADTSLSPPQQLFIKRAKLDFKIILRESGETAKFELFQRLNTGGAELSDQEIRNAMLVAANRGFFEWLKQRPLDPGFEKCVSLSERAYDEQFDLELALRFVVLRCIPVDDVRGMGDLGEFLTDKMMARARDFDAWRDQEEEAFSRTFALIARSMRENAFRKYDAERSAFTRGFSISSFEVVALGVGHNIGTTGMDQMDMTEKVKSIWSNQEFLRSSGSGVRASTRIPKTLEIGRALFRP